MSRLSFWLATFSVILNVLFILDFITYAFYGESIAAFIFADQSLSSLLLTYYPEMTSWEFLAANGMLLAFSVILLALSIWIPYRESGIIVDSSCRNGGRL